MLTVEKYSSPLGMLLLVAEENRLSGLRFNEQQNISELYRSGDEKKNVSVLKETMRWLDIYFSGREPNFLPPLNMNGTEFQTSVWKILLEIPYGETTTYGDIAKRIAEGNKMSAQAVGGAISKNSIAIIVPCHRVVGANGNLTGYSGGISKKLKLLELERHNRKEFVIPK